MKNCFIIHGSESSSKAHWFSWLENKLVLAGYRVFNLDYPTPQNQSFDTWKEVLETKKEYINKDTIFVCHSIAPAFVVKYCITTGTHIGALISVCGFNCLIGGELDKINKTMFLEDITSFRELCDKRICFYSNNDPYLKLDYLKDFAKNINAVEVLIKDGGHLNTDTGFVEFPQILNHI